METSVTVKLKTAVSHDGLYLAPGWTGELPESLVRAIGPKACDLIERPKAAEKAAETEADKQAAPAKTK